MKQLMNHNIIWAAAWPWRTSLRDCTFCVFFQPDQSGWHACRYFFRRSGPPWDSLQQLLGCDGACFLPLLSTFIYFPFPVLQRLDDVVLRCLPSKLNESFKKRTHTCDLAVSCCHVHRMRVAHNDVLPMVIFCTPASQLTPILMILTTSIVLLFNAILEHIRVSTTKYKQPCFHRPSVVLLRFFSKIQQGFMLQSHLSQSATQGDYLL